MRKRMEKGNRQKREIDGKGKYTRKGTITPILENKKERDKISFVGFILDRIICDRCAIILI